MLQKTRAEHGAAVTEEQQTLISKKTLNLPYKKIAAVLKTRDQSSFLSLTSDIILLISVINDFAASANLGSFS